jgi:hypothetical protein
VTTVPVFTTAVVTPTGVTTVPTTTVTTPTSVTTVPMTTVTTTTGVITVPTTATTAAGLSTAPVVTTPLGNFLP